LLLTIALIDGLKLAHPQQTGERFGVIVIGLVDIADQLVVARIANRDLRDQRFE
jgi:hypothetical protein